MEVLVFHKIKETNQHRMGTDLVENFLVKNIQSEVVPIAF